MKGRPTGPHLLKRQAVQDHARARGDAAHRAHAHAQPKAVQQLRPQLALLQGVVVLSFTTSVLSCDTDARVLRVGLQMCNAGHSEVGCIVVYISEAACGHPPIMHPKMTAVPDAASCDTACRGSGAAPAGCRSRS